MSTLPQLEVRTRSCSCSHPGGPLCRHHYSRYGGAPAEVAGRSLNPLAPPLVPVLGREGGSRAPPQPCPPRRGLPKLRQCFSTDPSASDPGGSPARKEEKKVRGVGPSGSGRKEGLGWVPVTALAYLPAEWLMSLALISPPAQRKAARLKFDFQAQSPK